MINRRYFVYMICNRSNEVLYVGYTNNIWLRLEQHRNKINPDSFSARYNVAKLVFVEVHPTRYSAFVREQQIKKWYRAWKNRLIEEDNPQWNDLAEELFKE